MKNIKVTKDGFIWLVVTEKAKEVFASGLFELYGLYKDDSESLIEKEEDIISCLENGLPIGIEVGRITSSVTKEDIISESRRKTKRVSLAGALNCLEIGESLSKVDFINTHWQEGYNYFTTRSFDVVYSHVKKDLEDKAFSLFVHKGAKLITRLK